MIENSAVTGVDNIILARSRSLGRTMRSHLFFRVGLALALATYVGLAARHLHLPGMYVDESLALIGIGHHAMPDEIDAERRFPFMNGPYAGTLKAWILTVPLRLFGFRIEVLRLTNILLAAIGLVCTALLARHMLGAVPAVVVILLLATDPSLILYTRTDWGPVALGFTLRAALLYALWRWWDGGGRAPLVAAGVFAGLGLWDKATFAWVLVAIGLVGLAAWFTDRRRPSLTRADALWAAGAFFAASTPFWGYNLSKHWATVRAVAREGDPDNITGILALSTSRTMALTAMFDGAATAKWMFGEPLSTPFGVAKTWLLPLSILGAAVSIIGGIATRRAWAWAIPALMIVILTQIYFTPRSVWVHHWITIYPLPQLAIGWALTFVLMIPTRLRPLRRALVSVAFGGLAAAVAINLILMAGYHSLMARTGGNGLWSDAIYAAADAVNQRYPDRAIRVVDWGIRDQIRFLTGGRVRMTGPYWRYAKPSTHLDPLVALVRDPSSVFLFYDPAAGRKSIAGDNLAAAARQACADVRHTERFVDRRSRPVIVLVEYTARACEATR